MTRKEYMEYHKAICDKMMEVTKAKNHDYSGWNDDPFANFKSCEGYGISTEIGFITRMSDKISRVKSFVDQGVCNVKDETIEDTLIDLANYSILMAGYIKS